MSQCPDIRSFPDQHPSQRRPLLSGAPEVAHHCQPVFILCFKNLPQVIEVGDMGEGVSVGSECPLRPFLGLLLFQSTPLPIHSPPAECYFHVPSIKGLLWNKHVTLGEPGVEAVTFLQDQNYIPHMVLRKVNPGVGPT